MDFFCFSCLRSISDIDKILSVPLKMQKNCYIDISSKRSIVQFLLHPNIFQEENNYSALTRLNLQSLEEQLSRGNAQSFSNHHSDMNGLLPSLSVVLIAQSNLGLRQLFRS